MKYPCSECGKLFLGKNRLSIHFKSVHLNEKPTHQCVPCGKYFVDPIQLKAHNNQSHGDRQKCPNCERSFLNGFILKRHLVFEYGIKDGALFCDKCPKKVFFEEVFLKKHLQDKHSL